MTIRPSVSRSAAALVLVAAALTGACRIQGKQQAFVAVGDEAATLRAAFNADVGKVRVVMLVAPS